MPAFVNYYEQISLHLVSSGALARPKPVHIPYKIMGIPEHSEPQMFSLLAYIHTELNEDKNKKQTNKKNKTKKNHQKNPNSAVSLKAQKH